jgi:hypothetical protein
MTIKHLALRVQSLYDAGLCAFDNELAQALVDLGDRAREIADLEVSCRKLTAALALATTGLVDLHNGYPPKEVAATHGTGLGRLIAGLVTLLRARGVDDDGGWNCPETSDIVVFGGSPARNRWPFAFTPDGLLVNGVPRRFVWNPTRTIDGRRARWACGQAAFEPVHMSTGRYLAC